MKDLRDKLPKLFTLRDLLALIEDKPDAILVTKEQAGELYLFLQKQTNPLEGYDKNVSYHGMSVEVCE